MIWQAIGCCDPSVCLSVCPIHAPSSATVHFKAMATIGNRILQVLRTAAESGAASHTLARWLHHRYTVRRGSST